jgi:phosphatidylserine/phosphatidylglycerophosphate/cardiolipin synthase-like enzyme
MLLINKEYAKSFKENCKSAKYIIRGFIYHDSILGKTNGNIIDDLIYELRQAQVRGVVVKIYCQNQAQIEKLRRYNFLLKLAKGFKTMHAKAFCFDTNCLLVGSHNFTENANTVNLEMSIQTNDLNDIIKYINYYENLWL